MSPFSWRALFAYANSVTVLLITAICAGMVGCATVMTQPPEPELPAKQWESGELIQSITQRREQFRSVRALARVEYAGPEGKGGVQEAILVQRPDRLRLETLSLLGAIMIVTVDDKEIIGYHPREGVMVRGKISKENLVRYTQIPLELDEITALLVGLPPVDASAPWHQEGNSLIFSPNGRKKDAVAFESQQPAPTKWERFNGAGEVELSARFSDYISTAAGLFPSRISMVAHLQGKKLEIRYQEPELNAPIPSDLFSQQKPAHVKELPIEAIGG